MDVLLITNYWHFECEKASSRHLTLANMISESGIQLEVITSDFYHATKSHRKYDDTFLNSFPYKVTLVHESGYTKNVSVKRILSHREFAKNVIKYIRKRDKPDVIYCVVPSLDVAFLVTKYANDNNIRVVVDIQDLWPETFKMVFNIPVVSDLILSPMKHKSNKIYAAADEIVAVSETYVNRALNENKKCEKGHSIFLGIELSKFDQLSTKKVHINKPPNEVWVAYIGTLGHSYDLVSVINAIKILKDKGHENIKFIVMGDGPLREKFMKHAKEKGINVEFTGKLNYSDMVSLLSACDIAVNPITKNSAASIINKHADYVAAGLPILNTQESKEFQDLIKKYNAGFNCENNNHNDLAESLLNLYKDKELRKKMGQNSRKLAEDKFNREFTYKEILKIIKCEY